MSEFKTPAKDIRLRIITQFVQNLSNFLLVTTIC